MITIAITRPDPSPSELSSSLEAWGARVHRIPTIERRSLLSPGDLRELQGRLGEFQWVLLTSPHAVRELLKGIGMLGKKEGSGRDSRWAVVGAATGRALEVLGGTVDLVPSEFTAVHLADALGDLRGKRVLIPRSRLGDPRWVEGLRERGAEVEDVALYDTVPRELASAEWEALEESDGLVFASGSALRSLHRQGEKRGPVLPSPEQAVFCIGPSTAEVAESLGVEVTAVASPHTAEGLLGVVTGYFGNSKGVRS